MENFKGIKDVVKFISEIQNSPEFISLPSDEQIVAIEKEAIKRIRESGAKLLDTEAVIYVRDIRPGYENILPFRREVAEQKIENGEIIMNENFGWVLNNDN